MLLRASVACLAGLVLALAPIIAGVANAESGVETYTPKGSKPDPMSSKDMFTLLGKSLGKNFQDLVVINGGCYTAGFTDAGNDSDLAKSGKNVALLAATSATCPREESQGTEAGNSFLQGIISGFLPSYTADGQPGTVTSAFDGGKSTVKRDIGNNPLNKEPQTPTLTTFGGGAKIQFGRNASSYHAILFAGKPTLCSDWKDIYDTYQALLASGYDAANINVLFGSGNRGRDGSPQLVDKDGADAQSVFEKNQKDPSCKYETEVDKEGKQHFVRLQPATHENFKKVLTGLQAIADKSATEQYFIWTGTHNTSSADNHETSYLVPHATPRTATHTVSVPVSVPVSTTTPVSWTGGYVGLELTGTTSGLRSREYLDLTGDQTNAFDDRAGGVGGGVSGGYNWQLPNSSVVVGPFASFDYLNLTVNRDFAGGQFLGTTAHWVANAGVKAGVATTPGLLVYGLVGAAWLNQDLNVNFAIPAGINVTTPGFTAGIGGEYAPPSWRLAGHPLSVFAQYQHTWWNTATFNTPASSPAFNYGFKRDDDTFKFGVNFHASEPPPPMPPPSRPPMFTK